MTLPPTKSSKAANAARWFFSWEGILVWVWLPYVLSLGPVYWDWYGARFGLGPKWLLGLYTLLSLQAELCPPFGDLMEWYLRWWT